MDLTQFLAPSDVHLALTGRDRGSVLRELAFGLGLDPDRETAVLRILEHRETMGSTGIGRGIAVPHCRTPMITALRVLYGRRPGGVPWDAIDGVPVEHFFLLMAPPIEVSNDYLPVLGQIARLAKAPDLPARLSAAASADEIRRILAEPSV